MSKPVALVTGAGGEMGHAILPVLRERGHDVVAMDLVEPDERARGLCRETAQGSILDTPLMEQLVRKHRPAVVFHLAAVLSSKAERDPVLAHRVNVEGTFQLMRLCLESAGQTGRTVRFMFPSSIAVYGLPDVESKNRAGAVREFEWNAPSGMYGCNKLYCELLGSYLTRTARGAGRAAIDFRCIRFPGLISAETLPTGGTSDYAPEMIHAAARGEAYESFVGEHTRMPFMTMPDAVAALMRLADADAAALSTRVYNIRGFSPSAGEIRDEVLRHFPAAKIGFRVVEARQAIVDSWPGDVDDGAARRDWGFAPEHGLDEAMRDYLIPALRERYAARTG